MYFENMKEARAHYEALRKKNEQTYQETGIEKFEHAQIRYEMIVQAMDAWLERQSDEDERLTRRAKNIAAYVDRYVDQRQSDFTKTEVKKMLNDMLFM